MGVWLKGLFTPTNPQKYRGDVKNIIYRSSWERTACSWFDTTPEVVFWESEETIVPYYDPVKQKNRKYYMDFKLMTRQADGTLKVILVEIKPYKQTIKPRANKNKSQKTILTEQTTWVTNSAKWAAAREYCKLRDWGFVILTEKHLYGGIDQGYKPPKK